MDPRQSYHFWGLFLTKVNRKLPWGFQSPMSYNHHHMQALKERGCFGHPLSIPTNIYSYSSSNSWVTMSHLFHFIISHSFRVTEVEIG